MTSIITPEYQQRVIDEKAELDERLAKLKVFLTSKTFNLLPFHDRELLEYQSEVMEQLSLVLGKRIKRFGNMDSK